MSTLQSARLSVLAEHQASVLDRRKYRRVHVKLNGRFMRADKTEFECVVTSLSIGGAHLDTNKSVAIGEPIVGYFDHIGGINGKVLEVRKNGFLMSIDATRRKKEKLAGQLTWLINRSSMSGIEQRRHDRINLVSQRSVLKLDEGIETECQVLDISLSGASVGTNARPQLGAEVWLGKQRARVMRHHDAGIGIQFLTAQAPEALRHFLGNN